MKRHRTTAKIRLVAQDEHHAARAASDPTNPVNEASVRPQPGSRKPGLTLADSSVRTHTLIPTGKLDRHSAAMLEAEIERLYDNGVTTLVLDLRELTYVDSTGLAVIAFRCALCKRRGFDLRLIPGSRLMHRAFEEAGVTDLLQPPEDRIAASRLPAATSERPSEDVASGEGSRAR
jgi:anti-anti-sigma factor